jgi:hypothetical protein
MRICYVLLLALVISIYSNAQEIKNVEVVISSSLKEDGELPYSRTPLTWSSFKGSPDNSCDFIAMTYSGIKIRYEYRTKRGNTEARVLLCPYMDVNQSWYKPEGYNEPTLAHEQRHFDIAAIVANEFAGELRRRKFRLETFRKEMKGLHKEYIQKLAEMQKQYDAETEHGIHQEKQAIWDKRLAEELRKALVEG